MSKKRYVVKEDIYSFKKVGSMKRELQDHTDGLYTILGEGPDFEPLNTAPNPRVLLMRTTNFVGGQLMKSTDLAADLKEGSIDYMCSNLPAGALATRIYKSELFEDQLMVKRRKELSPEEQDKFFKALLHTLSDPEGEEE